LEETGRGNQFGKLLARSKRLKGDIRKGKKVSDKERFPEVSIALSPALTKNTPAPRSVETIAEETKLKRRIEQVDVNETMVGPAAKKQKQQKKELVAKLPMNSKRLHVGDDGHMSVVEKFQVQPTDETHKSDELQAIEVVLTANVAETDQMHVHDELRSQNEFRTSSGQQADSNHPASIIVGPSAHGPAKTHSYNTREKRTAEIGTGSTARPSKDKL
jgi:hypothetical protein